MSALIYNHLLSTAPEPRPKHSNTSASAAQRPIRALEQSIQLLAAWKQQAEQSGEGPVCVVGSRILLE